MFNLIPLPYRILGAAALVALLFFSGVGFGYKWHKSASDAATIAAMEEAGKRYRAEVERGNALSGRLARAESAIQIKTVEVIKYVPKVTTGGPCLNTATVRLLQPGAAPGLRPYSGELAPEDAAPAASDTDIAHWIAGANLGYETCAERLNTLIDSGPGRCSITEQGESP
ncbi:MAG: hypothetical protein KKH74_01730 [Gammaproteobacteria bacterium]|nr:hypothetical protein [Gammaproteobacteria bacterium]MBU1731037.1 hypothetical protein [Gammaproteobacteria bacterium]MBU1893697.1 hypothetical protein [Gammaproteobacteria bacterium]